MRRGDTEASAAADQHAEYMLVRAVPMARAVLSHRKHWRRYSSREWQLDVELATASCKHLAPSRSPAASAPRHSKGGCSEHARIACAIVPE